MMVTYTLQSYDKGIMSAATQFGFNTDLGLTTIIGHQQNGTPITNNQKYSNAAMIFYIGYLCGTYPSMQLHPALGFSLAIIRELSSVSEDLQFHFETLENS